MTKKIMHPVYFDNSALNELLRDPNINLLIEKFLSEHFLRVSYTNIIELSSAKYERTRNNLFKLAMKLSYGSPLLDPPLEFLKRTLKDYTFQAHKRVPTQPTSILPIEKWSEFWFPLLDPNFILDEELSRVAAKETGRDKIWDERVHDRARPVIQRELKKLSEKGVKEILRTERSFLKKFTQSQSLVSNVIGSLLKSIPGCERLIGKEMEIIYTINVWPVFICGYGLLMYYRDFRYENHSIRKNPGWTDMVQCVYLPDVKTFVTHDKSQRRLLRVSSVYLSRRPEIMSYSEFRKRLLCL